MNSIVAYVTRGELLGYGAVAVLLIYVLCTLPR